MTKEEARAWAADKTAVFLTQVELHLLVHSVHVGQKYATNKLTEEEAERVKERLSQLKCTLEKYIFMQKPNY